MHLKIKIADPRFFQVSFQIILLTYGLIFLNWNADWPHYVVSIAGCLIFNYTFECIRQKCWLGIKGRNGFKTWGLSSIISALSLCLLLKTTHWSISLIAALLTVASKYIFRFRGKHIFNPSVFGIIATILITQQAWLSPGQWGNNIMLLFFILCLGIIVVTKVQKLDVSLAFLFIFFGLLFWRQVLVLHWPADYFFHSISTGSLLIFSFFMISDPKTTPNHPFARIAWAITIAAIAFYLSAFQWKYNTPLWVLAFAGPVVPLLDIYFKAGNFSWSQATGRSISFLSLKNISMRPLIKKLSFSLILIAMISHEASAFCGFYVSKADGTLKNKTSQVIIVRDGNRNVITMYNDFTGNFKDFAMVVPVPVLLKKSDIKVVDQQLFNTLNEYSKPRLVEYFDQNPCENYMYDRIASAPKSSLNEVVVTGNGSMRRKELGVTIEAKYLVGEYDILILSAKESSGLRTWLEENGYKIPAGADEVLAPYIKSNLRFFVVKVNEEEKKKLSGNFLRPIQISFTSPKFMLPIRLGMANADGDQDMLVYAFTKTGRIECTNYRTVSLPTGKNVPLFVQNNFGSFYANLFQHQWTKEDKAVAMLEYAWDVSPKNYVKCDPCIATAPSTQDLVQAGVWWLKRNWEDYSDIDKDEDYSNSVYFTRLHIRYNRSAFPQDLQFESTPNTASFQARYIITHPASGDLTCDGAKQYLRELKRRRQNEMVMLRELTGKGYGDWDVVSNTSEENNLPVALQYKAIGNWEKDQQHHSNIFIASFGLIGLATAVGLLRKRKNTV